MQQAPPHLRLYALRLSALPAHSAFIASRLDTRHLSKEGEYKRERASSACVVWHALGTTQALLDDKEAVAQYLRATACPGELDPECAALYSATSGRKAALLLDTGTSTAEVICCSFNTLF